MIRRVLQHSYSLTMDVDRSVSAHGSFDADDHDGKENATQSNAALSPTPKSSTTSALAPSALCNRDVNPPLERQGDMPLDISLEEEKLAGMLGAGRLSTVFGEGVRRESFPGKHTPDVSFNCGKHSIYFFYTTAYDWNRACCR